MLTQASDEEMGCAKEKVGIGLDAEEGEGLPGA